MLILKCVLEILPFRKQFWGLGAGLCQIMDEIFVLKMDSEDLKFIPVANVALLTKMSSVSK